MSKHAGPLVAVSAAACIALAGCGVSVAAGGENAATHPASGIWVATTVGSETVSQRSPTPALPYQAPSHASPKVMPAGLAVTAAGAQAAVTGGCWEDSRQGNVCGAYDQLFWWQGGCGATVAQIDVELYPSATAAARAAGHESTVPLLARYSDGAVIVDVYANAPEPVLSELASVKGLIALPGYAS